MVRGSCRSGFWLMIGWPGKLRENGLFLLDSRGCREPLKCS
jgi:hypothetical protein